MIEEKVLAKDVQAFDMSSSKFKFASAVASYGMMLWDSEFEGNTDYEKILAWSKPNTNSDEYREDFIELVELTKKLKD